MERLSFRTGNASVIEQARLPIIVDCVGRLNATIPSRRAVKNEARHPAKEAFLVILGDEIDFPTKEAIGSARDRQATAYRAYVKGNKKAVSMVPSKK